MVGDELHYEQLDPISATGILYLYNQLGQMDFNYVKIKEIL